MHNDILNNSVKISYVDDASHWRYRSAGDHETIDGLRDRDNDVMKMMSLSVRPKSGLENEGE